MLSFNRLCQSMATRFATLTNKQTRRTGRVREAMLAVLTAHSGLAIERIAQRVRYADDMEALWYLRQDVFVGLSALMDEGQVRRDLERISLLFKGCLPGTMAPRMRQRISI